jgi:hypothetical protein
MVGRGDALKANEAAVWWMDLSLSGRTGQLMGNFPTTQLLFADLRQQFSSIASLESSDILAIIRKHLPIIALACRGAPSSLVDFGTDRYWWHLLEGLASYIESGRLGAANAYVRYLRQISARGAYDPGMQFDLADATRAHDRLRPRMAAILEALTSRRLDKPIIVYNPISLTPLSALGYSTNDLNRHRHIGLRGGQELRLQCVDGNHRLAALWLGGAAACPVVPMWTNVLGTDTELESLPALVATKTAGIASLFGQTLRDLDAQPATVAEPGASDTYRTGVQHVPRLDEHEPIQQQPATQAKI